MRACLLHFVLLVVLLSLVLGSPKPDSITKHNRKSVKNPGYLKKAATKDDDDRNEEIEGEVDESKENETEEEEGGDSNKNEPKNADDETDGGDDDEDENEETGGDNDAADETDGGDDDEDEETGRDNNAADETDGADDVEDEGEQTGEDETEGEEEGDSSEIEVKKADGDDENETSEAVDDQTSESSEDDDSEDQSEETEEEMVRDNTERYDGFVRRGKKLISSKLFVDLTTSMGYETEKHPVKLVAGRVSLGEGGEITFDNSGSHEMVKALYNIAHSNHFNGEVDKYDGAYMELTETPDCMMAYRPIEAISAMQIGPGTIEITKSKKMTSINETGWRLQFDVKAEIPESSKGGKAAEEAGGKFSIGLKISHSDTKIFTNSVENSIGHRFEVPAGASCTPSIMVGGRLCNKVRGAAYFYRNDKRVLSKHFDHAAAFIPTSYHGNSLFKDVTGCIDYLPPKILDPSP